MMDGTPLVGIDVGSHAVRVVVARPGESGLEVLGCGQARHGGAPKGVVADLEEVSRAVRLAAEEAEAMASVPVERAVVGLGGPPVVGWRANAPVVVEGPGGRVSPEDRDASLQRCQRFNRPPDYRVLAVIPTGFVLDGQGGVREPVGLPASRLTAHAYVVHTHRAHWDAVHQAVYSAGIEIEGVYFEPLAAAEAVLTEDERELGCLLLDVGKGTTEWILFHEGVVAAAGCTPVAGRHFTSDLAALLQTPSRAAERIKCTVGLCRTEEGSQRAVEVPPLGGEAVRLYPASAVGEILQARARELLVEVHRPLRREELDRVPRAGVVLTGGGSRLDGLADLAEEILGHRVRTGPPRGLGGLAEAVGGEEWAVARGLIRLHTRAGMERTRTPASGPDRIWAWVRRTFGEIFEMGGGS